MALDLPGAAASALQGMPGMPGGQPDQSPAQAPVYQAPPAALPPTFFGRLLQGALNGLAGGVKQGQENIAGAGTPGFKPGGNGMAYAQEAQQQQDQAVAQKQQAAQQQAQQQFQNQNETFKNNQQAQLQSAQSAEIKLRNIQAVQNIQHADEKTQDDHFTQSMKDMDDAVEQNGGKELDHIKMAAGTSIHDASAAYLDQHPGFMADGTKHLAFSRDADGEVEVHVYQADPNARVSAERINSAMAATGSTYRVPKDTDMSYHEYRQAVAIEQGKQADFNHQVALKNIEAKNQAALESQRQGGEMQLEKQKEAAAAGSNLGDPTKPLQPVLETNLSGIASGDLTPAQATKGMGKDAAAAAKLMTARYELKYRDPTLSDGTKNPDYNPDALPFEQLEAAHRYVSSDKFGQSVQAAGELFGTKKKDGTYSPGAVQDIEQKMQRINAKWPALTGVDARVAAQVMKLAGDSDMEDLLANTPDVALKLGKFASSAGPGSESQFGAMRDSLSRPKTLAALEKTVHGMRDIGGETVGGMKAAGGQYAINRMANVKDPGTTNDSRNAAETAAGPGGQPKQRQPGDVINVKGQGQKTITKVYPNGRYDYK